jgi:type II secretory pathway component PulF
MIQAYYLIRFSRYTKIMLWSWLNYVEIFKMLKNVISNPIFTPLFDTTIVGLTRGQGIYDCIKNDTRLIPSTVAALIKVWEKTATLWHTFDTVISIYQEELDNYITNLSKIIEPIMLVFIGWIVIMIALGVFGVIMNIMDSVNV